MNPRELVDHIRSGPADLVLKEPLRFRRRTRSNPCDFNEFLQALQSSETIRTVTCKSQLQLGITEDEWVLLVKTLGSIKDIQNLSLNCKPGSRDFHLFQAVADAVKKAHLLRKLVITLGATFPRDPSGLAALANALREHTVLQEFGWFDLRLEATPITPLDPVLRALPACPHLREVTIMTRCASSDGMKNLLQLRPATELSLVLEMDMWLAVADEIRRGRCNVQTLILSMPQVTRSEVTQAVQALASAIELDCNLEYLYLQVGNGCTDEAGVALAKALTVNKTLRMISLSGTVYGAESYEAFAAMLRVNTSLVLVLPPLDDTGDADERLCQSRDQMRIEQRLNRVGRGRLLASSQTTKEEWVDALHKFSSNDVHDESDPYRLSGKFDSDAFRLGCLFSLFRLNPEIVSMS
jgi:hypothetical protein